MRLKKISSSLILLSIIFLAGCEGRFAGERAYNIQILNGNYQMKVVTVAGAQYLAVLNTNFRFQASTGSLQFYTLANPQLPVLQASMTLELPSNAGDFEFDGDTLYVADRNLHRILIYDFASGAFKARLDANANPVTLIVTDQPQTLFVFSRPSDQIKVLAVVCQGSGAIHFIRLDNLTFLTTGDSAAASSGVLPDVSLLNGIVGTSLQMTPRRTIKTTEDDPINISSSLASGYGINHLVYLAKSDSTDPIFVTASALGMALFGFRFDTFQDASNIVWNLPDAQNGSTVNGVNIPGTKENGFRGLVRDGAGNIFATSRADNGLYKIPVTEFEKPKEALSADEVPARRNTRGLQDNSPSFRIVTFDSDPTDLLFPRLNELAVNYCPNVTPLPANCTGEGTSATVAWVLGLGTKDGDQVLSPPKVYKVDLNANTIVATSDASSLGDSPQRILWYAPASLLYVANLNSNTISILNDSDLSLVGTLKN